MSRIRIISLLPSGTEIACSLGLKNALVGRSHECDYPPGVEKLPVCSEPKYRSGGSSREINRAVEDILKEALSIYNINIERIKELQPTHIITQSQCEVCAVSTEELQSALNVYLEENKDVKVIDLNPESLEHVLENILQVARETGVEHKGTALVKKMSDFFTSMEERCQNIPGKVTVAHIEWIEPVMVAGHWMMRLIKMAGGINCFPNEDRRWIKFEQLVEKNPDKIVIAPCGFGIEKTAQEMYFLEHQEQWNTLKAVKNKEVYICDGSHYFNRPGPRLTDSLQILAEIFYPDTFEPKHNKTGWIKYMD